MSELLPEKLADLVRPIIGVESRTPEQVFEIMCDRIRHGVQEWARLIGAVEQIAAEAWVSIDELPDHDQPNGWRRVAVERIEMARAALASATTRPTEREHG